MEKRQLGGALRVKMNWIWQVIWGVHEGEGTGRNSVQGFCLETTVAVNRTEKSQKKLKDWGRARGD